MRRTSFEWTDLRWNPSVISGIGSLKKVVFCHDRLTDYAL